MNSFVRPTSGPSKRRSIALRKVEAHQATVRLLVKRTDEEPTLDCAYRLVRVTGLELELAQPVEPQFRALQAERTLHAHPIRRSSLCQGGRSPPEIRPGRPRPLAEGH